MLSKEASSTIFGVFDITGPRTEPRPAEPLANSLNIVPISGNNNSMIKLMVSLLRLILFVM